MNIITTFITKSQSTKLIKPRKRSPNNTVKDSKTITILYSTLNQEINYTPCNNVFPNRFSQYISMRLAVIVSVGTDGFYCQSFSRCQQVIPEPQPISLGRYCQRILIFSTKIIPVRAFWPSTGSLPFWVGSDV
jgi:hypothetical protein